MEKHWGSWPREETEKQGLQLLFMTSQGASRLNSTYSRIARTAGVASNPPASRQITQENSRPDKRQDSKKTDKPAWISQHGKTLGVMAKGRDRETGPSTTLHDQPRGSSPINDNYCLNVLKAGLLPRNKQTVNLYQLPQSPSVIRNTMNIQTKNSLSADLNVVNLVPIAKGLSQKKD